MIYLSSLLHLDGADASTAIRDETGKVWTPAGNAQLDTAQSVFGGTSLILDGIGDYLSTPDHVDFFFDSGDFTIDLRARWATLPSNARQNLFSQIADANNAQYFYLDDTAGTKTLVYTVLSGGSTIINFAKTVTVSANTWYHIALAKASNVYKVFLDGTQAGTDETDTSAVPNIAGSAYIGQQFTGSYFNGWIDEYRISKGIARWTANFTPPPFPYGVFYPPLITSNFGAPV